MIESLRIGMAILAIYRVSQLFTLDDGPYACFRRLRMRLGMKAAEKEIVEGWDIWRNLSELFECPYCMGIWISLFVLPLIVWHGVVGDAVLLLFGLAGGQAFLESFQRGEENA